MAFAQEPTLTDRHRVGSSGGHMGGRSSAMAPSALRATLGTEQADGREHRHNPGSHHDLWWGIRPVDQCPREGWPAKAADPSCGSTQIMDDDARKVKCSGSRVSMCRGRNH